MPVDDPNRKSERERDRGRARASGDNSDPEGGAEGGSGGEGEGDADSTLDPEDYTVLFDDNPARERIPSGPAQRLYAEPDPDYDYAEAFEPGEPTALGTLEKTELRIESLDGATVKRYLLSEPKTDDEMGDLVRAVMRGDRYDFCRLVVAEPELTVRRWEDQHTPRERSMLYDHCFAWMKMSDFVTISETLE